ncbi:MAG: carotenoid biosynthesis protein [Chloroflexi bacterium]|nr:carotenoid biosynthesis protein [Chloroflexota bacterium]
MPTQLTQFFNSLQSLWNDLDWVYAFVQIGVLAVFLIAAIRAARHSPARLLELFTAFAFGLLLEEGDIIIFQTYRYDAHWFRFDLVPPAIAMSWALIIASAMNISDALGIDERLAPIADAVWAILLDLALDAVAIRLNLWTWTIPLDQGWFGVPYGNFYAWLFVAASFSFVTRWVRRRAATRGARQSLWQGGAPFAAYAGLLVSIVPYSFLQSIIFRRSQTDGTLFAIALLVFALLTLRALMRRGTPREPADSFLAAVRYLIHLYFLWALLGIGLHLQFPILLWVSLAMLAIEVALAAQTHRAFFSDLLQRARLLFPGKARS